MFLQEHRFNDKQTNHQKEYKQQAANKSVGGALVWSRSAGRDKFYLAKYFVFVPLSSPLRRFVCFIQLRVFIVFSRFMFPLFLFYAFNISLCQKDARCVSAYRCIDLG